MPRCRVSEELEAEQEGEKTEFPLQSNSKLNDGEWYACPDAERNERRKRKKEKEKKTGGGGGKKIVRRTGNIFCLRHIWIHSEEALLISGNSRG